MNRTTPFRLISALLGLLLVTQVYAQTIRDQAARYDVAGSPGTAISVELTFLSAAPTTISAQTYYLGTTTPLPPDRQPIASVSGNRLTVVYPFDRTYYEWQGYQEISYNGRVQITGNVNALIANKTDAPTLGKINVNTNSSGQLQLTGVGQAPAWLTVGADGYQNASQVQATVDRAVGQFNSLRQDVQTLKTDVAGKQNAAPNMGLSSNDFTGDYKSRLDNTSILTAITNPTDGIGIRYYLLAELPATTGGTYDYIEIDFTGKPWDNSSGTVMRQRFFGANRGNAFKGVYTAVGDPNSTGVAVYRLSDGRAQVYMKADQFFKVMSARVIAQVQDRIVTTLGPPVITPEGTLVYDTSLPSLFPATSTLTEGGNFFPAGRIQLGQTLAYRKLVLWDGNNNDHQFYGLGISPGAFRFQIDGSTSKYTWNAGTSATTSKQVMSLDGDGHLSLTGNDAAPNTALDVAGGWATFFGNIAGKTPGEGIGISLGWNRSGGQADNNLVWGHAGWPGSFFNISRFDGTTMKEQARFSIDDHLGVGVAPNTRLHVGQENPTNGIVAQFQNLNAAGTNTGTGAKVMFHYGGMSIWSIGIKADNSRFVINGWNGNLTNPPEYLSIGNTGAVSVANSLSIGTKLNVATGTNATIGTVTLSGGTINVSTSAVTASSQIFLTAQEGGTLSGSLRVSARNPGNGFTITSTNSGDNANVAYWIIN